MLEPIGDIYTSLKAGTGPVMILMGGQIMVVLLMMILKVSDVSMVEVV